MYKLINGVELPEVGIGTSDLTEKISSTDAENLLVEFLTCRADSLSLIDTAPVYGTEGLIGNAVKRAMKNGVPRQNILLQTKVPNGAQGYENTLKSFDESLQKLGVNFIDALLIHWPIPRFHEDDYKELNLSTWRAMEKLYKDGKVRAIGVSNFLPHHLENIISNSEIPPMINQLEIHFWYQQSATVKYCQQKNILVEAWGPFRKGKLFLSDAIKNLSAKHNVTPSKFALSWIKQRGILSICKSSSIERMLGNSQIPTINFDDDDLKIIANFDDKNGHEDFWNYKRQLNSCGGSDMDNLFDISGKTVLITGASSGIGESAAEVFAARKGGGTEA